MVYYTICSNCPPPTLTHARSLYSWWNSASPLPCWLSSVATHPRLTVSSYGCFSALAEMCGSGSALFQWIQVLWFWWPLILADESGAVGGDSVLCHTCSVCRCIFLLERWQKSLAVYILQPVSVTKSQRKVWRSPNHLHLLLYEVQLSFTVEAGAISRNNDVS